MLTLARMLLVSYVFMTAGACSSAPVTLPAPVPQARAFNAVSELPRDPDAITLGQAKEAAKRLRACERADAGL